MSYIKHHLFIGDPMYPTVFSLEETNTFVDEFDFEYRDHTKTNFVVEVYTPNDLDPYDKVYAWGGLEPTYFATYEEALLCFSKELYQHAKPTDGDSEEGSWDGDTRVFEYDEKDN